MPDGSKKKVMLKNHFKIVFRRLLKDKQFTFLNLFGLSAGLACTLLIYLWVADELAIDKFHEKNSRLYQVMAQHRSSEGIATIQHTPAPLADALAHEIPEVEYAAATQNSFSGKYTISVGDKNIKADGLFASEQFLNMFSFTLAEGNKEQVLTDKSSIVITTELAKKLFNTTENAIGKIIEWQHDKKLKVAGVLKEIPANSSIQFDFLLPFQLFLDANTYEKQWSSSDPNTYILLRQGANADQFNNKIRDFVKRRVSESKTSLFVRPFSEGYLHGNYENGIQSGGRIEYVRLFTIIALFILLIACINFMNLSTAKASRRLKEVGIKKVVGASRGHLIIQFMIESMLMTLLSLVIAGVLVLVLMHPFNDITGKQLSFHFDINFVLAILGITLATGVIAGSYPALYLSGFDPVTVLKGKLKGSMGELWVRRGLVIFQFSLSVIFIISVLVVYRQIEFIQSKNQGFNKDNVISFDMEGLTSANMETYLSGVGSMVMQLKSIPGVISASSMDHGSIINDFGSTSDIDWDGKSKGTTINFGNVGVNYGMIETLGMQVAEGRSFSKEKSSDSAEIIFNETAISMMGLKAPVGKTVDMWGKKRTIVGVVKDFHFQSLHEAVKPFAIRLEPKFTYRIVAKIQAAKESETIDLIRPLFQKYNSGYDFDYRFLDQDYQSQYTAEKRVATLSKYFSGLAIVISCLGLFGLSAFTAQRRQKEIGIRKAVGASVSNVTLLLSKDFLRLILIATIVAFPVAWLLMDRWLNNFVYRIHLDIDIFLIAGFTIFTIAIVTISFQSLKAAMLSPVKSLKSE